MKIKRLVNTVSLVTLLAWTGAASAQTVIVDGSGIYVNYYTPLYYLDYPVFFNDMGEPIYYVNGQPNYVPRTYANYYVLRRHYRLHRRSYRRWYRERGYRYRRYRRSAYAPIYHDGYVVYYDGRGLPYYYVDGRTVYIPRHHPRYRYYRNHYGHHGVRYRTWERRHGRAYRHRRVVRRAPVRPGYVHPGRRHRGYRQPYRTAPVAPRRRTHYDRRPIRRYTAPAPARGGVNCGRNPGHPSCRSHRGSAPRHRGGTHRGSSHRGRRHR